MRATSEVMYTENGRAYQCVELDEDEIKRSIYVKDIPPDVEAIFTKFRPLPFPPESEPESK